MFFFVELFSQNDTFVTSKPHCMYPTRSDRISPQNRHKKSHPAAAAAWVKGAESMRVEAVRMGGFFVWADSSSSSAGTAHPFNETRIRNCRRI